MRFRPWPKPEPYRDTSRKRAAFKRKQASRHESGGSVRHLRTYHELKVHVWCWLRVFQS